jgi:rhodanese-related sulfurtransferase
MKPRAWLVAFAVVFVLAVAAVSQVRSETLAALIGLWFPDVQWVDTATLADWMNAPPSEAPLLLDVRSEDEFAVSHLRGAVRVEPGRRSFESLIDESRPVVVYCSVGYRSAAIVGALEASGIADIHNLRGGIFTWANEGRPLFRGEAPASTVHPYDELWGVLLRDDVREPSPSD